MDEPPRHESFIELGVLPNDEPVAGPRRQPTNPAGRRLLRHRGYALAAALLIITLVTASTPFPVPVPPARPELLSGEPLLLGALTNAQSPGGTGVAAYRVRDGAIVWRLPFDRGFIERLVVFETTLVIGAFRADSPEPDGERLVLGVDAGSGQVLWSWPGLLLAQDGEVAAVIDRAAGRIWGFTARTGALRWTLDLDGQDAVTAARFPQSTEELLVSGPDGTARLVELSSGAARGVPRLNYGEIPIWLDRGLLMTGRPDDVGTSRLHRYAFYESRSMTRLWEKLSDTSQTPEPCRPHVCLVIQGALGVHARSTGEALSTSRNGDVGWRVAGVRDGSLLVVASGAATPDRAPWLSAVVFDAVRVGEPTFRPLLRLPSVLDGFGAAGRPDLRGAWLLCPARACADPVRLTPQDLSTPTLS